MHALCCQVVPTTPIKPAARHSFLAVCCSLAVSCSVSSSPVPALTCSESQNSSSLCFPLCDLLPIKENRVSRSRSTLYNSSATPLILGDPWGIHNFFPFPPLHPGNSLYQPAPVHPFLRFFFPAYPLPRLTLPRSRHHLHHCLFPQVFAHCPR